MKQRTFLTIIFVAAFLFLAVGISQLAVTDPVESNYALTALEMVRSGDWLSPQIYGTYWYDKPIFLYWLLSLVRPAPDGPPHDSHPLRRHDRDIPDFLVRQPLRHH